MQLVPEQDIIAVHQMGKVGSTTVFRALKKARPELKILHTHHFRPANILHVMRKTITPEGVIPPHLRDSLELHHCVKKALRHAQRGSGASSRIHIISLIRDPIARNISAFFENLNRWLPKLPAADQTLLQAMLDPQANKENSINPSDFQASLTRLQGVFLRSYKHDIAETWMQQELAEPIGLQFTAPFDHHAGFTIYEHPPFRLIVFVLEQLDHALAPGLTQFLGIPKLNLSTANQAANKGFGAIYQPFVKSIRLPEAYLDQMYGGKMIRYFYSAAQLAEFRSKWVGRAG